MAVGSAYTGIYDRPDLGRRDLRRLSAVLAGAENYELVLVDCPPSLNGLTRMAWSASDKVALVAEPGLFSVAGTERTMRAIQLFRQEFAPNLSPAGIVANRVRTGSSEHTFRLAEMESMFGDLLLTPHIPEQANWQQIQGAAHSDPPLARRFGQERRRPVRHAARPTCWPPTAGRPLPGPGAASTASLGRRRRTKATRGHLPPISHAAMGGK